MSEYGSQTHGGIVKGRIFGLNGCCKEQHATSSPKTEHFVNVSSTTPLYPEYQYPTAPPFVWQHDAVLASPQVKPDAKEKSTPGGAAPHKAVCRVKQYDIRWLTLMSRDVHWRDLLPLISRQSSDQIYIVCVACRNTEGGRFW